MPSATASSWRSSSIASCDAAAERHRELAAVGERLEHRDRPVAGGGRLLAAPRPPQQARQPAQVVADAQRVAGRLVDREQRAARLDRAGHAPAEVGLDRDALERLDADGRVGALLGGERRLPVLERLAVAARRARGAGGRRGEAADRVDVGPARRAWWASRAGSASPSRLERAEDQAVELAAAHGGEVVLDGAAGEVVAERDRVAAEREQPGGDALVDRAGVGADRLAEQPQLGRAGDDRGELDDRAGRGRDAVDAQGDGVADARRDAAAGGGRERPR